MKRRQFNKLLTLSSGIVTSASSLYSFDRVYQQEISTPEPDVVVAGAGLGGCAAAWALLRKGMTVVLTEETHWIGGQMTSQGVPPDEHQWIETMGAPKSYRIFRDAIRSYYRANYPLSEDAKQRQNLNPGNGAVSRLCHEPRVAQTVLSDFMTPYLSNGKLQILLKHRVIQAESSHDRVESVVVENLLNGEKINLSAKFFVDATELGDLLPLTGTEYVNGSESKKESQELHGGEVANPQNVQAFTMCFAMDYIDGANLIIDKPEQYDFWKNYVPELTPPWSGKLLDLNYSNPKTLQPKALGFDPRGNATGANLNLWNYRRIVDPANFEPGFYQGGISIVNWPQNDYMLGNLIGASTSDFNNHLKRAKQLSLSLFYWLQTSAPRPDGGLGWPGLRLRGDIMGSDDGMALYPYIRESRRIKARFTVKEEHVGAENRLMVSGEKTAAHFSDSVGIGYYHIDLHPSCAGDNYIDFASLPFQIPLGALLPERMENLLPANKNIGTTHITNGCYRLHPVEWSIGEAVGLLIAYSLQKKLTPQGIYSTETHLADFQSYIRKEGIETEWHFDN
ncbi:MAG: FAD-dependent oxidoreductase [Saprospiraceae bacterium]|nr:FAD-dependent oxidoreductase [Saprospiraceae bacterium]